MSIKIKKIRERTFQISEFEKDFLYNKIDKEIITEFDENSFITKEIITDNYSTKSEWLYKYKFDNNKRITQILKHKNKEILQSEFDFYETNFFYDHFGNKIQIQTKDETIKNIFQDGKIVESSNYIGNHKTSDFTLFEYNENKILVKSKTQFIETYYNSNGTINREIDTSGNDLFGIKTNNGYLDFNFQSFEYDTRNNVISGKGENIPFYSDDNYIDIKYNEREVIANWQILYSFDKFDNWINKIYIVNMKPSTFIKREIEYY